MTDTYFDESWLDKHYTGAPDECDIHWPTKEPCPDPVCTKRREAWEKLQAAIAAGEFDPNCARCDLNLHSCPGCGLSLNHKQGVCDECKENHA